MNIRHLWLPEVKYSLLAIFILSSVDIYSRFFTTTHINQSIEVDSASLVVVPRPPVLTNRIETLLAALEPVSEQQVTSDLPPVDPSAGQLGALRVSLKAVFLQNGLRRALFQVADGSELEIATLQQDDELSGFHLTTLQQNLAIFQQGEQRVVLRLFKNNSEAAQTVQGNN